MNGNESEMRTSDVPDRETPIEGGLSFEYAAVPITIALRWAGLEDVGAPSSEPIDVLAVGHMVGETHLTGAARALDRAVSRKRGTSGDVPERERLLTSIARRGVFSGQLGHLFSLADPRAPERLLVLAGVGVAGRLKQAELSILVGEMCWTLGRMGRRHLAAPLIGSGPGNMSLRDALMGWIRGVRSALCGMEDQGDWRLQRITLVTNVASDVEPLDKLIAAAAAVESKRSSRRPRLALTYEGPGLEARRSELEEAIRVERFRARPHDGGDPAPVHVAVEWTGDRFRIGVMTATASVPERDLVIDPALVVDGNKLLELKDRPDDQLGWGQFMSKLLLKEELRSILDGDAPLVMLVDPATAAIHWEMLADPGPSNTADEGGGASAGAQTMLGIFPGVSRQLRTTSARPEPAPPTRRLLRILVIADPADNLPVARREGEALVELFRTFNDAWHDDHNKIEVVSLIGSQRATRNEVLFHLTRRSPYHVLHFAGHGAHDDVHPEASGWVFARGEILTIHELDRVDRIPRFVFSNACRSGDVEPARVGRTRRGIAAPSRALAPSLAASFFERGVANLVCAAWNVDEVPARDFALELYAGLLGLSIVREPSGAIHYAADRARGPEAIYRAMRRARHKLLYELDGASTWGAYQHYGDPYFRLIDADALRGAEPAEDEGGARSTLLPQPAA